MNLLWITYTVASLTFFALKYLPLERPYRRFVACLPHPLRKPLDYLDQRRTTEFCRDIESALTQKIMLCPYRVTPLEPSPMLHLEASLDALRVARCRHHLMSQRQAFTLGRGKDPSRPILPIFVSRFDPNGSTADDVAQILYSGIDRQPMEDPHWTSFGLAVSAGAHTMELILLLTRDEFAVQRVCDGVSEPDAGTPGTRVNT